MAKSTTSPLTRSTALAVVGRYRDLLLCLLILACGLVAYYSSFDGVFVFDDSTWIVNGDRIKRDLWPPTPFFERTLRPVLYYSLAINYRLGGLETTGYHVFNVTIHLLAALALFGVVRRTLLVPRFDGCFDGTAHWFALAAATLWVVHPLPTQAVNYIIQRCESMAALCMLLMLYGQVRGATARRRWPWSALAIVACTIGMGCKPTMFVAPILALMYDRIFLANSWPQLLRQRWLLYVGILPGWLLLASGVAPGVRLNMTAAADHEAAVAKASPGDPLAVDKSEDRQPWANQQAKPVPTPWQYARSQPAVILHYLRLVAVPQPLCLDYRWPVSNNKDAVLPGLVVTLMLVAAVLALLRWPPVGFLGCAFFILLAPTSSILPIEDLAFEHRMYLPSAAVIILSVFAVTWLIRALVGRTTWQPVATQRLLVAIWCVALVTLGAATIARHQDYADAVRIWDSVLDVNPRNVRAMNNRAAALLDHNRVDDADRQLQQAALLEPRNEVTLVSLAEVAKRRGDPQLAYQLLRTALQTSPDIFVFQINAGVACEALNRWDDAVMHYRRAIELRPRMATAHKDLGFALIRSGQIEPGLAAYRTALGLDPNYFNAHLNLGVALTEQGQFELAVSHLRKAVALRDTDIDAEVFLAMAYRESGDLPKAALSYRRAADLAERAGDRQRASALRELARRNQP